MSEVEVDCVIYGERAEPVSCRCPFLPKIPRLRLGLPKIETRHAIGVGIVVGDTDALFRISLAAAVEADDPGAADLRVGAPVAQMQPSFDRRPIRLRL